MSAKKPKAGDLPAVRVDIPAWAAVVRARRRLEAVQSATGRVATLAGAAAVAVGMFTPALSGWSLLADAALTLAGLATLRLWRPEGLQRATASVLYLMPGASLGVLLAGQHFTPDLHPVWATVEAAALLTWTVGTWVVRPAQAGRHMLAPPPPRSVELAPAAQVVSDHPLAHWWARLVAVKDGPAPDTALDQIERTGERSMRAIIRSTVPGKPVPDISIKSLSALMDVPEEDIAIGGVPGRGAGVRLLTIGREGGDDDLATAWSTRIAPAAMPGAILTGVRVGRPMAGDD
ncbi:hypothetical protein ABZW11_26745 [Nonomuraea sp. NPDC004580]|uniref:hypothetical protein n=1 Tax=Nonomuraea sp. NPDC004580 TaxID=3154552 RepID=UPI0033A13D0A